MRATTDEHQASGTFLGVEVRTGPDGGLASGTVVRSARASHFHASRLPEFGDVVLSVTRVFDDETAAALGIELRAFSATAPGRGALAELPLDKLIDAPGVIAVAELVLAAEGDEADERRAARLTRCVVSDAAPTVAAARGVADWLRATWETELAFGSWPAVSGTLEAFAHAGGEPADWAAEWLRDGEHRLDTDARPASFLKVLSAAWLEPGGAAAGGSDAATDDA